MYFSTQILRSLADEVFLTCLNETQITMIFWEFIVSKETALGEFFEIQEELDREFFLQ